MSRGAIPILPHARVLKDRYRAWLCDVWGVVHNGVVPFGDAVDALIRFREEGGLVLLVTNAPRPASPILAQLERIGVPKTAFDALVTSGDAARHWLARLGGRSVFHIGPARDRTLFADLGLNLEARDEAEIVLCTGLVDDQAESVADYERDLAAFAERGVTMMCANPDLVVDRGGTLVPCAGALAARFEELGGATVYAGKPHRPIYDLAFARLAELSGHAVAKDRVLAIGDGLKTDMAGAAAMSLDALFIVGGIHIAEVARKNGAIDEKRLSALLAGFEHQPIAAQRDLIW